MPQNLLFRSLQTALCLLMTASLLVSCEEQDPLQIPVPNKGVEVNITRLDQEWFEMSAVGFRQKHPQWQQDLGELYTRYVEDVLNLGSVEDSNLFAEIRRFTTDQAIAEVQDSVQVAYPDLSALEEGFEQAWSYYLHYFPNRKLPVHAAFIGGFNTPAALTENGVGIGLEMYLGKKCAFYDYLQLPLYLRERMSADHIVPTVMHGWIGSEFPLASADPTLLEAIVQEGKVLYAMEAVLPDLPKHILVNYTAEQMKWALEHQPYVWAHFVDKELLFSTNSTEIAKYTNDGPFTVDLVKESPPRMGHFIGWQIVRAYMAQQDQVDLKQLMALDAETLLNQSKYKP
jgi:hypothetical protein